MNDFLPPRGRIRSQERHLVASRDTVRYVRRSTIHDPVINSTTVVAIQQVTITEPELQIESIEQRFVVTDIFAYELAKTAKKADVLSRAVMVQQRTGRKKRSIISLAHIPKLKSGLLAGIAVVVLAATGYVGFDTWHTNNQAKVQIGQQANAVSNADSSLEAHQAAEGADKTPLPSHSLQNYAVASSLPRALYIDKIKVAARILPMNVNPNGSVQAPVNIFDAGWYTGSVKPGEIGAMFIDGHSSGNTHEGLFGNLDKLIVGDTLQVEKGDGTRLTYKVVHTAIVDKDAVDMHQMLLPYGNVQRALNLMTCIGSWVTANKTETLTQRIEVFTEQVS
jgi:LPXTG-site transpeptidase (sortase) family protein